MKGGNVGTNYRYWLRSDRDEAVFCKARSTAKEPIIDKYDKTVTNGCKKRYLKLYIAHSLAEVYKMRQRVFDETGKWFSIYKEDKKIS